MGRRILSPATLAGLLVFGLALGGARAGEPDRASVRRRAAAVRMTEAWKKQYGLKSEHVEEQIRATLEGMRKVHSEKRESGDAFQFRWRPVYAPKDSKRTAILLRGGQPGPENLTELGRAAADLDIKGEDILILNLRRENRVEEAYIKSAPENPDKDAKGMIGMRTRRLRILPHTVPTLDQVKEVLQAMVDPANKVVLLHGKTDKERAGMMVAAIRIAFDGWDLDEVIDEAKNHGLKRPLQEAFIRTFAKKWKSGEIKLDLPASPKP